MSLDFSALPAVKVQKILRSEEEISCIDIPIACDELVHLLFCLGNFHCLILDFPFQCIKFMVWRSTVMPVIGVSDAH